MKIKPTMKLSSPISESFFLVLALLPLAALPAIAGSAVVRGDFDNDGDDDVVAIRDGQHYIRADAGTAGSPMHVMTFNTPPLFLNPDTAKAADIDQDGYDDVLLASRQANRLLVIYGQTVLTSPFRTDEFPLPGGPTGADAAQFIAGGSLEIVSVLNALPNSGATMLNAAGEPIKTYALPAGAGNWHSIDVAAVQLLPGNPLPQYACLSRGSKGAAQIWWAEFTVASPGAPPVASASYFKALSGMDSETEVVEFSVPRLASGRLLAGSEQGQWVVLPDRTNALTIIPADVPPLGEPVDHRESLDFVGHGGAVLPETGGDLIVVTAADGTFARLFRWQGPGDLVVVETIPAPQNQSLLHALPLSDGNLFMALRGPGVSPGKWTAFAHFNRTGNLRGYTYVESLPPMKGDSTIARVMVFDRDPFGGDALEWESFSLGGWATGAEVQGGKVLVDFQTDPGVPGGLGELTTTSLTPRLPLPASAVALANQWEPDSSVFFGVSPALSGGAGVSPQPPPGGYHSPVSLSFAAAPNVVVNFRLGIGGWQTGRGPVEINRSTTVEFYGVTPAGLAGPIGQARYTIGEPPGALPGSLRQDSDQNGLDDAWERLFFGNNGVDPDGDADGDLFTNRGEYDAGTNPRDALSVPPGQPGSTRRMVTTVDPEGRFRFRLESDSGAEVVPEYSTNLRDWFPLPGTLQTLPDGSREWTDLEPPTGTRFYRLVSPEE